MRIFAYLLSLHLIPGGGDESLCVIKHPSFFRPPSAASGAAQPPRPQEARAARSLGKAKACFEPCFEDVEKKQRLLFHNAIYYILQFIFIPFIINTFSTPFTQDLTHNPNNRGFGGRVPRRGAGAEPLHQSTTKLLSTPERGERGGAAAAPAGRRLPQEARAARSSGKAKACLKSNVSRGG